MRGIAYDTNFEWKDWHFDDDNWLLIVRHCIRSGVDSLLVNKNAIKSILCPLSMLHDGNIVVAEDSQQSPLKIRRWLTMVAADAHVGQVPPILSDALSHPRRWRPLLKYPRFITKCHVCVRACVRTFALCTCRWNAVATTTLPFVCTSFFILTLVEFVRRQIVATFVAVASMSVKK